MTRDAWWTSHEPDIRAFRRARKVVLKRNPDLALKEFEALAARDSQMSMVVIAEALRRGLVYPRDIDKAKEWYGAAINRGSVHGLHGLGMLYYQEKEYHRAREFFDRAAKSGFSPSMNNLAHLYYTGRGGPADRPKAMAIWERASRLGNVWAKRNLGRALATDCAGVLARIRGRWLQIESEIDKRILRIINTHDDRLG